MIDLKIFYYINKFRNSWFWRTEIGKKVLLAIIAIIVINLILISPYFLGVKNAIFLLIFLMLAVFIITYKPRRPSPMEKAGHDWTIGQQKAIQEERRRKEEQRAIHRMNEFMRR